MDLLRTEDAASVMLFDLRLSEGELQYLAIAAEHALKTLNDAQLYDLFDGEDEEEFREESKHIAPELRALLENDAPTPADTREFLQLTYEELMSLIQRYCRPEFLAQRFRAWQPPIQDNDAQSLNGNQNGSANGELKDLQPAQLAQ